MNSISINSYKVKNRKINSKISFRGVKGKGIGMSGHDPVLSLNLVQAVDAIVNNSFVFRSVFGFDGIQADDSSFSESDDHFAVFSGFVE